MKLSAGNFNKFLNAVGQEFAWRRAYACPCVNPMTGGANTNCLYCHGKGKTWDETATNGMAGVVSRNNLKKFSDFGMFDPSDVMLSIPSDSVLWDIGQYDRVSALNRSEPFSINLVYGVNEVIRYPLVSIERVSWINNDGALVLGDIPTISPAGEIIWGSSPPPEQTTYSITGRWIPEYFVYIDLPYDRPEHAGEPLPRRVIIRKFDLFGR